MKIYVDVTNLTHVTFLTGIQRVVREILVRMRLIDEYEMKFVAWNQSQKQYYVIENKSFGQFLSNSLANKIVFSKEVWNINQQAEGKTIFFDMDSVWNEAAKRSFLYPLLKSRNYEIYTLVYDVIPILFPQYCHKDTVYRFLDYLTAVLTYSDIIFVNAKNTKKDLEVLLTKIGKPLKRIEVVTLGADFSKNSETEYSDVREDAVAAAGKGRYLLTVGTIEPRKNHKYLLDCFDEYLFKQDINLIIAGREGWNVADFMKRMKAHPQFNERLFFIEKADDRTIDYLYRHAFMFVFPSFYEGFGLPIIEAMERNVVTVASDIEVFREVGGDYCHYIDIQDTGSLAKLVTQFLRDPDMLCKQKNMLANYRKPKWDASVAKVKAIIDSTKAEVFTIPEKLNQVYILSARKEGLAEALRNIDLFIPFVEKVLIECPAKLKNGISADYIGRLTIEFITDEELLEGKPLPEDHQKRNFYLRCLAIASGKVDEQFIMYDDDYKPLATIKQTDFIENNRYKAYYFYDLEQWQGDISSFTSFDIGAFKTLSWLRENHYPTMQYSSHMPQVINRKIFMEMINRHPELQGKQVDEWSTYFNYAVNHYADNFSPQIYKTLCWPGKPTDWEIGYLPEEYLFENTYADYYREGDIFAELPLNQDTNEWRYTLRKILIRDRLQLWHIQNSIAKKAVDKFIKTAFGKDTAFCVNLAKGYESLNVPEYLGAYAGTLIRIPVSISGQESIPEQSWDLSIVYQFEESAGKIIFGPVKCRISHKEKINEIRFPFKMPQEAGKYVFKVTVQSLNHNINLEAKGIAAVLEL